MALKLCRTHFVKSIIPVYFQVFVVLVSQTIWPFANDCLFKGCPIHPICNGSPKWWRSVTGRDGLILFVSLRHVGGPSRSGRMVITVDSLSVRKRLRKHSWRRYGVGYGVRWKCRRIVPIGTERDDPSQP